MCIERSSRKPKFAPRGLAEVPLILGHRGDSAHAPENTLVAFEKAIAEGSDGIEFDVRLSRDGVPVVIHDADLRRTGLKPGVVADLSSAELCRTDVGSWFNRRHTRNTDPKFARATIPTLNDVVETLKESKAWLYIEMKFESEGFTKLASEVARIVDEHSVKSHAVVECFGLAAISEVKRIDPTIRTAALFEPTLLRPRPTARSLIKRALDCEADEVALHHRLAVRRTCAEAAKAGLQTVVWTVDNKEWVDSAIESGIHGLISNDPARLRSRLDEIASRA